MNNQKNDTNQWIVKNNLLRDKLEDANKDYYEKLLTYIRTVEFFYDEDEIESLLYAILSDIVLAQEHGEAAADYLGRDPKEMADSLISKLENPKFQTKLKLSGYIVGISLFFSLLGELAAPEFNFNPILLLLKGFLSFIIVYLTFFYVHKNVYSHSTPTKIKRLLGYFYLWLISSCVMGTFILIDLFTPKNLDFTIPNPFDLIFIGILMLAVLGYVFLKNPDKLYAFLPITFIIGMVGIYSKLAFGKSLFNSTKGRCLLVVAMIVGYLVFSVLKRIIFKTQSDK